MTSNPHIISSIKKLNLPINYDSIEDEVVEEFLKDPQIKSRLAELATQRVNGDTDPYSVLIQFLRQNFPLVQWTPREISEEIGVAHEIMYDWAHNPGTMPLYVLQNYLARHNKQVVLKIKDI